jgi:hypothetical protein
MAAVGSKRNLARSLKGASEDFAPSGAGLEAPAGAHATPAPSLRDRLAEFFRSGQNASDRELAALLGASVGSISVYRCQLKKLGIGVASPPGARLAAAGKRERRTGGGAKPGRPAKRTGLGKPAKPRPTATAAMPRMDAGALSLAEIDQVLIQNLETELGLIVERFPELARPVANIQQTVRLLLKLHRQ